MRRQHCATSPQEGHWVTEVTPAALDELIDCVSVRRRSALGNDEGLEEETQRRRKGDESRVQRPMAPILDAGQIDM